jgi:hypothetical protein
VEIVSSRLAPGEQWSRPTRDLVSTVRLATCRIPFVTHLVYALGAILFIIGSALFIDSQPRFFLSSPVAPFPNTSGSSFEGACVCFIIGSAIWVGAGFLHVIAAMAEVSALRVAMGKNNMPLLNGVPRYIHSWAWLTLLGSLLLLIGSCIFIGKSFDDVSAGSIIWMIGFTLWFIGISYELSLALMAQSMAPMMWDMRQRYRAWRGARGALVLLVATIFFMLGSLLYIVIRPPGSWLLGGLLWLVASSFFFLGQCSLAFMRWQYHVPILTMLAAESTGAMLARSMGTGAVMAAPMGVPQKTAETGAAMPGAATQAHLVNVADENKGVPMAGGAMQQQVATTQAVQPANVQVAM